jgi:hypothetical protein
MNAMNERTSVDPVVSVHELMNDATEWLQYAQRLTGFVSELIEDAGELKGREMAAVLMVIDALMSRGLDRAMQAHTQMVQEQLHEVTSTLGTN